MLNWPIYKKNLLIIGNLENSVAICSLWTKREKIAQGLDPNHFSVIGNLYSGKRGLDPLLRNLLANPSIRYLVVCGSDISGSGESLLDFFRSGFKKESNQQGDYWAIESRSEGKIDIEIAAEALEQLREKVKILDCRKIIEPEELMRIMAGAGLEALPPWGEPMIFPKKESQSDIFPAEQSVHVVRGRTVAECWLKLLNKILLFGITSSTHYENQQKEILNLVTVISEEDPENPFIPEWLPNDRKHLEAYYPKILTAAELSDTSYTYGHRMRAYFGRDQVQDVIDKLKKEPDARSAVISLWDPQKDHSGGSSPCINHLWVRLRKERLYLTVVIRSNDMFEGWPENAFGLRQLQQLIAKEINCRCLGELTIISQSAHIYDDCWEEAKRIVGDYWARVVRDPRSTRDPHGNFIISLEENEIKVEHCSPTGDILQSFKGRTVNELIIKLAPFISLMEHGLYLGSELQKAEIALESGISYIQDQPLK